MKNIFLLGIIVFSGTLFSQTSNGCDSLHQAKEGSYKLVKLQLTEAYGNTKDMLSENDLCYIESVRKASDTVIVFLPAYKVVVYPLTNKKQK